MKIVAIIVLLVLTSAFLPTIVLAGDKEIPLRIIVPAVGSQELIAGRTFPVIVQVDTDSLAYLSYDVYLKGASNPANPYLTITSTSDNQVGGAWNEKARGSYNGGYRAAYYQGSGQKTRNLGNDFGTFVTFHAVLNKVGETERFQLLFPPLTDTPAKMRVESGATGIDFIIANENAIFSDSVAAIASTCGDGIVGYIDANNNDMYDSSSDPWEACDHGNIVGSNSNDNYLTHQDGCSSDCKIVDIDYSCSGTGQWQHTTCTKLKPRQILKGKINAMIDGSCYPNANHPAALYCNNKQPIYSFDADDNLKRVSIGDNSQKYNWIKDLVAALAQYFRDTHLVDP